MARPAGPGRSALLDAGMRLIADTTDRSLGSLSVNAIVAAAGMSKGAFFQHFPTRAQYVAELHRTFHEEVTSRVDAAIRDLSPGLERLRRGIGTYLDACLELRTTKAFLFQARADVQLSQHVASRNAQFAERATADLETLEWADAPSVARLIVAAVAEIALVESESGRADYQLRRAVLALVSDSERLVPGRDTPPVIGD